MVEETFDVFRYTSDTDAKELNQISDNAEGLAVDNFLFLFHIKEAKQNLQG